VIEISENSVNGVQALNEGGFFYGTDLSGDLILEGNNFKNLKSFKEGGFIYLQEF
jgi:hypothetical protein